MIISKVEEEEWLAQLEDIPLWNPGVEPVFLVAPHPDDETLGAGGFIFALRSRGVPVNVVAVTNGENAYPDIEDHDIEYLGSERQQEQERALAHLGVTKNRICRLDLPDSSVSSHQEELEQQLYDLVEEGSHLVAPWSGDFHPDHQACGRAAEKVALQRKVALSSYFFWTWHQGEPNLLCGLSLRRLHLDPEWLTAKTWALAEYRSQLVRVGGEPILPERLLRPARRSFEVFAFS
jgi:LmbE family N-acetylglucosaminyl deacetylase